MPFLIFYVTYPDKSTAEKISLQVLERKLAACANIFPIQSAFWWDAAIHKETEWVSILKTTLELETTLETTLIEAHPYQTPCILRFEARANDPYENWIRTNVKQADQ